jgi:PHD/YefM family antitoxin component YafN of YafNO toxin-antitoxin module
MKAMNTLKNIEKKFIVDDKGRKSAVIVPIEEYKELLEDLHDLAIVAERRSEQTISFSNLKKKLKRNGLL